MSLARRERGPAAYCTAVRWRELTPCAPNLLGVLEALRGDACPWLLDSALLDGRLGRASFAGADPFAVVRVFGSRVEVDVRRPVRPGLTGGREWHGVDPLSLLRELLPPAPSMPPTLPVALPFVGGAVGYLGYELAGGTLPVTLRARDDLGLPDAVMLLIDRLVALDHESGRCFALGLGFHEDGQRAASRAEAAADAMADRVARSGASPVRLPVRPADLEAAGGEREVDVPAGVACELDRRGYEQRVAALRREIEAGNVYEANLTQRMTAPWAGDVWPLYLALRARTPAPFAAYLELPEAAVLCSSPERFLRVDADGGVESRPIKGTRARDTTPARDAALGHALATSEKDRAENLMIVDLVRNDLGRVCRIGSVRVPELWCVERYASVFQLVSTVAGRLRDDCDALDALHAAFPPGSMTGAPKIAAVRLLDRLEPVRRGIYSGAIGYLDVRGGLDLSVVIRTLVVTKDRAHLHVGGAVVADSDPAAEYDESLDKAAALFAALEDCTT